MIFFSSEPHKQTWPIILISTDIHSDKVRKRSDHERYKQMKNSQNIQRLGHTKFTFTLKLKYGLSLLKIHEKYKKYIFRIIFYISLIKNDKQTKKGKENNIFKSLARSNVFSERPYFNFKVKGGIYLFLFSFWKRQVHSHRFTQQGT
jgi:hypothetical protein